MADEGGTPNESSTLQVNVNFLFVGNVGYTQNLTNGKIDVFLGAKLSFFGGLYGGAGLDAKSGFKFNF